MLHKCGKIIFFEKYLIIENYDNLIRYIFIVIITYFIVIIEESNYF